MGYTNTVFSFIGSQNYSKTAVTTEAPRLENKGKRHMISSREHANLKLSLCTTKRKICVSVMDIKKLKFIKLPGEFYKAGIGKNTGENDNSMATLTMYSSSIRA